ncbi:MAG: hypothetical protein J0H43_07605, partial [Actinobacteria bacterium]|nr:hypothetical protein [Actinomycetota bacterium]
YPLFFSAHVTRPAGVDLVLGYGATYLAGTFQKPAPVQVAWLWPLIDRPHRLDSDTVFTDDDLTTSVSPGGRLYRALDVAETVADATDVNVQLTLLIDPELIDELQVMASGKYQVQDGKITKPGSGEIVAQDWLARLHDLITTGAVDARLTPYADPDIESLSRHGLSWSATMPAAMKTRVTQALGGLPPSTVSWPAGSALSANTLASLVKGGASTIVLDSGSVRPPTDSSGVPVSLARLSSDDTDIVAALTSSSIEKYAAEALTLNGAGTSVLPALMSQLAIRATGSTGSPQTLLITAPRYVDPDESLAEQVITATSSSRFTTPTSLTAMTSNPVAVPTGFSQLAKAPAGAATLSATALGDLAAIGTTTDELKSMLDPKDEAAQSLLAGLPAETQRIASAGWYGLGAVSTGNALADQFTEQVATVPNEVYIVTPSSGTYTLASSNSPLPLTVENDSRYRVRVQIDVPPVYGLTVKPIGEQWIEPQSKRTLHLPTD